MCKSISDKESEETLVLVAILKLMLLTRHSDQGDGFSFGGEDTFITLVLAEQGFRLSSYIG